MNLWYQGWNEWSAVVWWLNDHSRPESLDCLKTNFKFVVRAITMEMLMKECYFILLLQTNVHHISPLSPIKIWNPWNLKFQAFTTQNHVILEAEETDLFPMQQKFEKHPGEIMAGASFSTPADGEWASPSCFSTILLYLKTLLHRCPCLS